MLGFFTKNRPSMSLLHQVPIVYGQLSLRHGLGSPNWGKFGSPTTHSALIDMTRVPQNYDEIASNPCFVSSYAYYVRVHDCMFYVSRGKPIPELIIGVSLNELNNINTNQLLTTNKLDTVIRWTGHSERSVIDQINDYHDKKTGVQSMRFDESELDPKQPMPAQLLNLVANGKSPASTSLNKSRILIVLIGCGIHDLLGRESDYNQYAYGLIGDHGTIYPPHLLSEETKKSSFNMGF
jgi:hypothetical protein